MRSADDPASSAHLRRAGNDLPRLIAALALSIAACSTTTGGDAGVDAGLVDGGGDDLGSPDGSPPGCASSAVCPTRFFCRFPEGTCGGTGVCEARPTPMECATVPLSPVCGCDGVPYDTSCAAYSAGTNVLVVGGCPTP